MAWFSRKDKSDEGRSAASGRSGTVVEDETEEPELPLRPQIERPTEEDFARIYAGRAALEAAGIDAGDLDALGAAYDTALAEWQDTRKSRREDEREIVERFATAIGEHLHRTTDLSWSRVTDAFGSDLAVAGGKDDFVVVPSNLVAVRWMNAESGWIPAVVGHLVRVRADR